MANSILSIPEAPKVCPIFHLLVVNKGSFSPNTFSIALYSVKSPFSVPGACITIASTSDKFVFCKAIFIDFWKQVASAEIEILCSKTSVA